MLFPSSMKASELMWTPCEYTLLAIKTVCLVLFLVVSQTGHSLVGVTDEISCQGISPQEYVELVELENLLTSNLQSIRSSGLSGLVFGGAIGAASRVNWSDVASGWNSRDKDAIRRLESDPRYKARVQLRTAIFERPWGAVSPPQVNYDVPPNEAALLNRAYQALEDARLTPRGNSILRQEMALRYLTYGDSPSKLNKIREILRSNRDRSSYDQTAHNLIEKIGNETDPAQRKQLIADHWKQLRSDRINLNLSAVNSAFGESDRMMMNPRYVKLAHEDLSKLEHFRNIASSHLRKPGMGKAVATGAAQGMGLGMVAEKASSMTALKLEQEMVEATFKSCVRSDRAAEFSRVENLVYFDKNCNPRLTLSGHDRVKTKEGYLDVQDSPYLCKALLNDRSEYIEEIRKLGLVSQASVCKANAISISGLVQGRAIKGMLQKQGGNFVYLGSMIPTEDPAPEGVPKAGPEYFRIPLIVEKENGTLTIGPIAHNDPSLSSTILANNPIGGTAAIQPTLLIGHLVKSPNCQSNPKFDFNPSTTSTAGKLCALSSHLALLKYKGLDALANCKWFGTLERPKAHGQTESHGETSR